ncbi:UNKNOWN [Stylonychia lemnae]|uniref:Uncharacterized protein n=1 Tax=Stylonychia lemnae TaxID=5949 RepID=A0A077ZNW9_STYLE|nr:UNKNOWN [Stylonychia lemnae]|eukprot:CDW71080.1 UNKNOWN [Stylonychia lemnae]
MKIDLDKSLNQPGQEYNDNLYDMTPNRNANSLIKIREILSYFDKQDKKLSRRLSRFNNHFNTNNSTGHNQSKMTAGSRLNDFARNNNNLSINHNDSIGYENTGQNKSQGSQMSFINTSNRNNVNSSTIRSGNQNRSKRNLQSINKSVQEPRGVRIKNLMEQKRLTNIPNLSQPLTQQQQRYRSNTLANGNIKQTPKFNEINAYPKLNKALNFDQDAQGKIEYKAYIDDQGLDSPSNRIKNRSNNSNERSAKSLLGSSLMQSEYLYNISLERKKQLKVANDIQQREKSAFIMERKQKLNVVYERNRQLIKGIPSTVASDAIKNNFLKMRRNLMIRTIQAEIMKKKMVDWTMPKLIEIAKKEDRAKTAAQAAKAKILNNINNTVGGGPLGLGLNGKFSSIEPQILNFQSEKKNVAFQDEIKELNI